MSDLWYPGGVHDPAPSGAWGTPADSGEPKFLIHTTQSHVYEPDPHLGDGRRYYGRTGTWPNYTLAWHDPSNGWRVHNHVPANRSSLALVNRPGGVETNRDNVTQCEIATLAEEIQDLPVQATGELAKLLAWEHLVRGVPLRSTVRWVAYPASYGSAASQRLSATAWDAYAGVLGHQHAPENDHGDPGDLAVADLLARAAAYVNGDDVMTTEQQRALEELVKGVPAAVRDEFTKLMRLAVTGGGDTPVRRMSEMAHGSAPEALGIGVLGVQELRAGQQQILALLAGEEAPPPAPELSVDQQIGQEVDPIRLSDWVRQIGVRLHAIHTGAQQ